ncbi:MAG: nucleotide exchange factor GrpE [Microgenomates group bacterium]
MKTKSSKTPLVNSEVKDLRDQLARSLADYSNLEKRIEAQRQMFVTLATMSIINKMVDVLDDLYLTNSHLNDDGLQMTINKFINVLSSEGLAEIATNVPFNPETMECVSTVDGEDNVIISVHKKGYTLNGQVIRPAQVIVGKKITN